MKNNQNPRTCLITKTKKQKNELIRFIVDNHKLVIDIESNLGKRGYYISKQEEVIKLLEQKKHLLNRFKANNIDEFISSLKDLLGGNYESQESYKEEPRHKKTS